MADRAMLDVRMALLREARPDVTIEVIPHAGHWVFYEAAQALQHRTAAYPGDVTTSSPNARPCTKQTEEEDAMGPRLVDHLLYEPEDSGILWIKFNRPERMNALVGRRKKTAPSPRSANTCGPATTTPISASSC